MILEAASIDKNVILVDGKWKKCTPEVAAFAKKLPRGSNLKATSEDEEGVINRIDTDAKPSFNKPFVKASGYRPSGESDEKLRGVALSYAKDLVIAEKVDQDKMFTVARTFFVFLKEGKTPDEKFAEEETVE